MAGGVTVKDVNSHAFVKAYAAHLKKSGKLPVPEWTEYAKTGSFKELSPYDPDWFYVRAAAIARHLYIRPDAGVGALRTVYGGPKRRGTRPTHHAKASGSVIRKAIQGLEQLNILEKSADGGRRVSRAGQRELDRIAAQVAKQQVEASA
ncbi:Protein component of the small (40S) ribosomal subunit [Spiromyces aspiralis]|uniref:Protein component of the small (40S) ribosomal subunit n=1 Tax=Spiromyces aspiralis TaxID=68401 RepID=A0ACC1HGI2_9FUNG|nr:Protein component of the small (40S) ribosomal subunit [Spiromyces aspiralis]